jgi:hypothetical protein
MLVSSKISVTIRILDGNKKLLHHTLYVFTNVFVSQLIKVFSELQWKPLTVITLGPR